MTTFNYVLSNMGHSYHVVAAAGLKYFGKTHKKAGTACLQKMKKIADGAYDTLTCRERKVTKFLENTDDAEPGIREWSNGRLIHDSLVTQTIGRFSNAQSDTSLKHSFTKKSTLKHSSKLFPKISSDRSLTSTNKASIYSKLNFSCESKNADTSSKINNKTHAYNESSNSKHIYGDYSKGISHKEEISNSTPSIDINKCSDLSEDGLKLSQPGILNRRIIEHSKVVASLAGASNNGMSSMNYGTQKDQKDKHYLTSSLNKPSYLLHVTEPSSIANHLKRFGSQDEVDRLNKANRRVGFKESFRNHGKDKIKVVKRDYDKYSKNKHSLNYDSKASGVPKSHSCYEEYAPNILVKYGYLLKEFERKQIAAQAKNLCHQATKIQWTVNDVKSYMEKHK